MGKRKDLSDFDVGQVVMARRLGQSISKTAALVGCSRAAVVSVSQKRRKGGQSSSQGHGRPRLAGERGERRLACVAKSHNKAAVAQIAEINAGSVKFEHTVHCRRAAPMQTSGHCPDRLQWAQQHQNWTTEEWKKVAWSGESHFLLAHVDGKASVRWLAETETGTTVEGKQDGGGIVKLWATFCWETLGPVVSLDATLTCSSYLNILADHVHPFMEAVFPDGDGLFQQGNTPCHTAKAVQGWFEEHDSQFKVLPWPRDFTHLNPIEQLWNVLDKQVRSTEAPPGSLEDLRGLLLRSWCQIPPRTFRRLVESVPQRLRAVSEAKGQRTRV